MCFILGVPAARALLGPTDGGGIRWPRSGAETPPHMPHRFHRFAATRSQQGSEMMRTKMPSTEHLLCARP